MQAENAPQLQGPFSGVKFSSTSIPSTIKKELRTDITSMGGIFFDDLMADVNVLIVGDHDTEKYKFCAKRRCDIKFVKAEAIYTLFDKWKQGEDFDSSILEQYISPVFDRISICMSRLSNVEGELFNKAYISTLIKDNKGTPTESLLMSTSFVVTTEKAGKRFEKALEWGIPVVHPRWVLDSVRRGAILESTYYDITKNDPGSMGEGSCIFDLYDTSNPVYVKSQQAYRHSSIRQKYTTSVNSGANNLLSGLCFLTYGFTEAQMAKLGEIITQKGGNLVDSYENAVTHLLIPSSMPFKAVPGRLKQLISTHDMAVVNEWFLDRSLFYKQLKFDSWSIPRNFTNLDLKLRISVSGFSGVEFFHVSKLIEVLGCELVEVFQPDCNLLAVNLYSVGLNKSNSPKLFQYKYADILSCRPHSQTSNKSTKAKINAAKKWGIPVISLAYLWEISEQGKLPNLLDYRWCIFGPRSSIPAHNFIEYAHGVNGKREDEDARVNDVKKNEIVRENEDNVKENGIVKENGDNVKQNEDNLKKNTTTAQNVEDTPRIPSPKKKTKRKWPRLVGTALKSQLKLGPLALPSFTSKKSLLQGAFSSTDLKDGGQEEKGQKEKDQKEADESQVPEIRYDISPVRAKRRRRK
ncbi:hypothetical protein HII12_004469 [Brettanomyces bruxellensis]|uniref:BRCT domain-containing protein n=1 Tax=Dekkera bruxellensis TaxID=5007 RepID=A0A8H6BA74_DEKBR|nr:hypothetical protein HII12_004469 [Brettanomyces bruxellensis]